MSGQASFSIYTKNLGKWKPDDPHSDYTDQPEFITNVKQEILEDVKEGVFFQFGEAMKNEKGECVSKFGDECTSSGFNSVQNIKTETINKEAFDEIHVTEEKIGLIEGIAGTDEQIFSSQIHLLSQYMKVESVDRKEALENFEITDNHDESSISPDRVGHKEQEQYAIHKNNGLINQDFSKSEAARHVIKCSHCSFQTKYKSNLKKHLVQHGIHSAVNMQCDQCGFQTIHKYSYRVHLMRHKNPEELDMLKCEQCNFQTIYKSSLKSHMRQHIPEDAKLKCQQCNYTAAREYSMKLHVRTHESRNQLNCDRCNFKTNQKAYLTKHLKRHKSKEEGEVLQCFNCSFFTNVKEYLINHMKYRHEKAAFKFKCSECDYSTNKKSYIKTHVFQHYLNLRPHGSGWLKCEHCTYKTIYKRNLKRHNFVSHRSKLD